MTRFDMVTKDVDTLAEYILSKCDNPMYEIDEDICDLCDCYDSDNECCEEKCLESLKRVLNSEI